MIYKLIQKPSSIFLLWICMKSKRTQIPTNWLVKINSGERGLFLNWCTSVKHQGRFSWLAQLLPVMTCLDLWHIEIYNSNSGTFTSSRKVEQPDSPRSGIQRLLPSIFIQLARQGCSSRSPQPSGLRSQYEEQGLRSPPTSIEPRGRRSSGGSCSRQSLGLRGWDGLGQTRSKEKQGFVVVVFVGAQEGSRWSSKH